MTYSRRISLIVLCLLIFYRLAPAQDEMLQDNLEQEPEFGYGYQEKAECECQKKSELTSINENKWQSFSLKASYRYFYILRSFTTQDKFAIPFNISDELKSREFTSRFENVYQVESKVQVSEELYSYIRLETQFNQEYDHEEEEYSNSPGLLFYEAYLDYRKDEHWLRAGGLIEKNGKVDFDSPIDILNLSDQDRLRHLHRTRNRFIMPMVKYTNLSPTNQLRVYWGPFQRVSEDSQAVRTNVGVVYEEKGDFDYGVGFFHWFDDLNDITISSEELIQSDNAEEVQLEDTEINFLTAFIDMNLGDFVLKSDLGIFQTKNFYNIEKIEIPAGVETSDDLFTIETLQLAHIANATSLERKWDEFYLIGIYSYRLILDAPADTQIFQYENYGSPQQKERNLERHQVSAFMGWDWSEENQLTLVSFYTFPFESWGVSPQWTWKPYNSEAEWKFSFSHLKTEVIQLTGEENSFNRVQMIYKLSM